MNAEGWAKNWGCLGKEWGVWQRVKKWAKSAFCGEKCNFVGQGKFNDGTPPT